MKWDVEYTDEFELWWDRLSEPEQDSVQVSVMLLGDTGPYRVLYAFDPRRCAILLIGGDKTGQDRWYQQYVPLAERLYDEHLEVLKREGFDHG
ncbi:hypothetical protein SAMN03159382_03273 [Pseudomonas sp. NFACC23-1]|uniref:type II toxin-antitoxin system RelE/ParE family toxin n=1 Tax=unclassified Pseudomonas TaxID=196821 RepID=UPI00088B728A|nr:MULTISPECIES: type II toxin-antitoxin system RelE/ParE family toxin [unclassified Pseudomonas]SDB41453.1 hypothetical protein SAMN03159386_03035 [Pseudomonas sp. NFACC17-2]SEJ59363.1 hypothetical protein SAMN03159382_03273 [Pseudomonas sp. NFACC23-1]SFW51454.1 hypothetical protein SAMN05660640_01794 [Pseudomonas sp. NFACC16-2]